MITRENIPLRGMKRSVDEASRPEAPILHLKRESSILSMNEGNNQHAAFRDYKNYSVIRRRIKQGTRLIVPFSFY